ncbi:putative serine/threonine-protein kinase isoform X2 [Carex littledalei]|uniref:non-specific serine/threonine protein kinase n=1 Tax=Carex littledalei TaxID=544730 RepID=A0A833V5F0_9POAL|nr:putative serine/threonine-protein kinase isoform X2 [Carex littledalei]
MSCLCGLFGKNSALDTVKQNEDIPGINRIKIFTYNELRKATDGFSFANKIGEGGFGSVYKGKLKDGTILAVKVLSTESRQGVREFLTELTIISDIKHENLVRLYGCCVEGINRILVYPYMENNSLAQTLLGRNPDNLEFNWQTRVNLCTGVARGLSFLHDEIRPPIIHRDIKASNILLDKDLTPKISDFGLAKLLPPNATHVSTRVAGTIPYIFVFMQTWTLYEQGDLEKIVDAFLGDDLDIQEATRFLKVALLCTQDATKLRPSMSTVLKLLTGEKSVGSEKITKPAVISDFMDLKVKNTKENNNYGQISTTISSSAMASTSFSSSSDTTLLTTTFSDKN